MRRYELLIFLTGAVTLSLEVLASRIMTPYFGVSLYIWAGILSITLAFLAVGYHLGGVLTRGATQARLEALFLTTPVISAASIGVAVLLYPAVLPALAKFNLVVGSFIGALLLLGLPLIALSAMNPLLIALQRKEGDGDGGDAGAGRVFFISTVGSVAGVLFTAFVFIPSITNFRASLVLAMILCLLVMVFAALATNVERAPKRRLIIVGVVVALLSGTLAAARTQYLEFLTVAAGQELRFDLKAEYTSIFGNVKVADVRRRGSPGGVQRFLVQDGLVQNRTLLDHSSVSLYTHVLEALTRAYVPAAKDVLVLGLGAGVVPRNLAREGIDLTVVEINEDIVRAAVDHFGFDPGGMRIHREDARTYVRDCRSAFDAVVVDLFLGDNIPDYLLSREFFGDLRGCLRPGGAIVLNGFSEAGDDGPVRRLVATIATAFPRIHMTGLQGGNLFIVASTSAPPERLSVDLPPMPADLVPTVSDVVQRSRPVQPEFYRNAQPVSDDHNIFSVLFAPSDMARRQGLVGIFPPTILVN